MDSAFKEGVFNTKIMIGVKLNKVMKDKGFTQSKLSLKTGIKKPQLSTYMNNKHTPTLCNLKKISEALGVSIFDII